MQLILTPLGYNKTVAPPAPKIGRNLSPMLFFVPIDPTINIGTSISILPQKIRLVEPGPSTTIAESDASCKILFGV